MTTIRAMITTTTIAPFQLRMVSETVTIIRVSRGSLALPSSLYMPANTGIRKSTMPVITMSANEAIISG